MATSESDVAGRLRYLEEGLTLARAAGADGESAMLLAYLAAAAAEAGDLEHVRMLLEEGVNVWRADQATRGAGYSRWLSLVGWLLPTVAWRTPRHISARHLISPRASDTWPRLPFHWLGSARWRCEWAIRSERETCIAGD